MCAPIRRCCWLALLGASRLVLTSRSGLLWRCATRVGPTRRHCCGSCIRAVGLFCGGHDLWSVRCGAARWEPPSARHGGAAGAARGAFVPGGAARGPKTGDSACPRGGGGRDGPAAPAAVLRERVSRRSTRPRTSAGRAHMGSATGACSRASPRPTLPRRTTVPAKPRLEDWRLKKTKKWAMSEPTRAPPAPPTSPHRALRPTDATRAGSRAAQRRERLVGRRHGGQPEQARRRSRRPDRLATARRTARGAALGQTPSGGGREQRRAPPRAERATPLTTRSARTASNRATSNCRGRGGTERMRGARSRACAVRPVRLVEEAAACMRERRPTATRALSVADVLYVSTTRS